MNRFEARAKKLAADLQRVRAALAAGTLHVSEGLVESRPSDPKSPRDVALEVAGRAFSELYIAAADAKQRAAAKVDAHSAALRGAGASALHHLFILPGFGDDVPSNLAYDWMVVAEKNAFGQIKGAKAHAQLTLQGGALGVAIDDKAAAAIARVQAVQIDAPFIRLACWQKHRPCLAGASFKRRSPERPNACYLQDAACKLLARLATEMEAGRLAPFSSLNVTLADDNADVRMAKQLLQSALLRHFQQHGDDRNIAAIKAQVDHSFAVEQSVEPSFVRGFLLTNGLIAPEATAPIDSDVLSPAGNSVRASSPV